MKLPRRIIEENERFRKRLDRRAKFWRRIEGILPPDMKSYPGSHWPMIEEWARRNQPPR